MSRLAIDFFIGRTKPIRLGLRDPATNRAVDLSGLVDAFFTARNSAGAVEFTYRLNSGITVVDPVGATTDGEDSLVDIEPLSADSLALTAGEIYQFDLWLKFADGKRAPVAFGDLFARAAITSDFTGELDEPAAAFRLSSDGLFFQLKDKITGKWRSFWLENGAVQFGPEET